MSVHPHVQPTVCADAQRRCVSASLDRQPYVRTRNKPACPHTCVLLPDAQSYCVSAVFSCGRATRLRVRCLFMRTRNFSACPHCNIADTQQDCVSALCTAYMCGHARLLHIRSLFTYHTPHKIIQSVHVLHNDYSYTSPKCKNLHRSRLSAPSRSPNHPSVSARPIPHLLQHSFRHTIVNSFPSNHNDIDILTHPM